MRILGQDAPICEPNRGGEVFKDRNCDYDFKSEFRIKSKFPTIEWIRLFRLEKKNIEQV